MQLTKKKTIILITFMLELFWKEETEGHQKWQAKYPFIQISGT